MCTMKEKKLTKAQVDKIAEIKSEWAKEIEKIDIPYKKSTLSNKSDKPYRELEKKYSKMMQEVIDNG